MLHKISESWTNYKKDRKDKHVRSKIVHIMAKHNAVFFLDERNVFDNEAQYNLIENYTNMVISCFTKKTPKETLRIQLIDKAIMYGYFKVLEVEHYIYPNSKHRIYISSTLRQYAGKLWDMSPSFREMLGLPKGASEEAIGEEVYNQSSQYLYYLYGLWAFEKAYYWHKNEWIQDLIFVSMVIAEHKFRKNLSLSFVITDEQYKALLELVANLANIEKDPKKEIETVLNNVFGD